VSNLARVFLCEDALTEREKNMSAFLRKSVTMFFIAVLLACLCSVGISQTASTLQTVHAHAQTAPSIPGDAVWWWNDDFYQAWVRPIETDTLSGTHFNLEIQKLGGGVDFANFHVTYEGLESAEDGSTQYVWGVSDSIGKVCSAIQESGGLSESEAASNAFYQLVQYVSNTVSEVGGALVQTGITTVTNLFEALINDGIVSAGCSIASVGDLNYPTAS
jgi:hypothetical protein